MGRLEEQFSRRWAYGYVWSKDLPKDTLMNTTQIVLLGGGYTTLWAYRSLVNKLRKEIDRDEVRLVVVCPEDHHYFHGWTAESLTGIVQNENRMSSLEEMLDKATLVKGYAVEIDSVNREIQVNMECGLQCVHYDHLLIGMGSYDSEQIAGVKRHGYQVKSDTAFLRTQRDIRALVSRAAQCDRKEAELLLRISVCGAGFTGVELVTNIAEFIAVLKAQYPSLHSVKPTIRLIHSKSAILDTLPSGLTRMRKYAEKVMRQYGIEVILNRSVTEIAADGIFLDDHSYLPGSMVISTSGQSRVNLKGTESMRRDSLGRICANRFLLIEGHGNIWGGGDACSVPYRGTSTPCVPNALWAMKHGEYAAANIARTLRGQPLRPFTYRGLGQCASLGIGKGIGELYGLEFTGWSAWIMRWFFFNYFMPSRAVMRREIADWMHLLLTGKRKGLVGAVQTFVNSIPAAAWRPEAA